MKKYDFDHLLKNGTFWYNDVGNLLNRSHTWFSEKNTTAAKVFRDSCNKFQLCLCLGNLDVITSTVSEPEVLAIFQFRSSPEVK